MSKLAQTQAKKLVSSVMSAFADFAEVYEKQESAIERACDAIAALVKSSAIPADIKPTNLGKMFFGDEFGGNNSNPNPAYNFIRSIVDRLRRAGVLIAPERAKSKKAVTLPSLLQLQALASLQGTSAAEYADQVFLEMKVPELKALITMMQSCINE